MLSSLLRAVLASEVAGLGRLRRGLLFLVVAAILLLLAAIMGLAGLALLLSQLLPAWQAALVVAAVVLLAALVVALWGRSLLRRRRSPQPRPLSELVGQLAGEARAARSTREVVVLVALAAAVGLALGRKL
jgi:hypothetical protein